MLTKLPTYVFFAILNCMLFTSCIDDIDNIEDIDVNIKSSNNLKINDFVYRGLNHYYLYKNQVPDLANNRFNSNTSYNDFLNTTNNPKNMFNQLLTKNTISSGNSTIKVDRFSRIVDDYIALEQSFSGISKSNGMEFGLKRYPNNSSKVFAYVQLVLPNTDAESKGITRGVIFNRINEQQITTQNYRQLINSESYTIGLATFDGTTVTPIETTIQLSKSEYTENPVFLSKTLTVNCTKKIGYLMYNSFTANFDSQLNAAFGQFVTDGVTDLVIDLRYNGGGSVKSSLSLSSMITGQFKDQEYIKTVWNEERQPRLGRSYKFTDKLRTSEKINSLNLTRVFIITTKRSASSSELIINGLDPYINVIKIGAKTRGKFQGSITLYDSENFRRQNADPSHTYAMQPLVIKAINSVGHTDYYNGFRPDIPLNEDYSNLGILGNVNEPLLKAALDQITGTTRSAKDTEHESSNLKDIGNSKMFAPNYERMYINN